MIQPPTDAASFHPIGFRSFLAVADSAFRSLSDGDRIAVASLLYRGYAGQSQHISEIVGVFPLRWRDKHKAFGSAENFEDINDTLNYFRLAQPAQRGFSCEGYRLSDKAKVLVGAYLDHSLLQNFSLGDGEVGLENEEGKPFQVPYLAIRPYTTLGSHTHFRKERKALKAAIDIDGESLRGFVESAQAWLKGDRPICGFEWLHDTYEEIVIDEGLQGGREAAQTRASRGIAQAAMILDLSQRVGLSGPAKYAVPSTYVESSTGRLYAEGGITLQGAIREVRRAAFRGAFDVDIDCCHVALIASFCDQLNFPTPLLDEYASDKAAFRQKIAVEVDISIGQVKKLVAALTYGAKLSLSPRGDRGSLERLLGIAAVDRIRSNPTIPALGKEIRAARKLILHDFRFKRDKMTGSNYVVNDARRLLHVEGTSAGKQLSHIVQGAEANILKACMQIVPNVLLLVHDGLIAKEAIDLLSLQKHVAESTGHHVTFTQRRL